MKTPRELAVREDPKLKALWKKLVARVHAYEKESAEQWDVEWETVGAILDHSPPLYAFGGHRNAAEFLKKELGVEERVGRAYVRVARHATPEDEIAFGIWKLDAIIGFLEATHSPLAGGVAIAFAKVKIGGKRAVDLSIPAIKAATKSALAGKKSQPKTAFRDALARTFAKHGELAHVAVHEANGKTSFHGVPNAALRTFAEIVLETKLPR
ncbi:MAG TPA: hypothetical protein VGH28_31350 [Polyangiaceae bacterium]|jgi:hypothetical protein